MTYTPGKYANSAKSTVTTTALTATSTSITLAGGDGKKFPATAPFLVALYGSINNFEFARVTGISGDTLSPVVRGAPGPVPGGLAAQAWATGSTVELVVEEGTGDLYALGTLTTNAAAPLLKGNTAQALAASGTITTAGLAVSVVTAGATCTGVILQAGTTDGQLLVVINTHATNALTMAVAGTSNVADGVSDSIAALMAGLYVWNAVAALWYRVKAA